MVIGKQYEPFVIPCKPTSPKVRVELIKEDGEVTELSYNETIGFVVVSTEAIDMGFARCYFSLNSSTHQEQIFFQIDRRFTFLIIPAINDI